MNDRFLTAAIDVGTSFSTWSFSFQHDFKRDKCKVNTKHWNSHGSHISMKAPTCVLIRADSQTIHSFGYDAWQKYHNLASDNEHDGYYFFQNFKMQLYAQKIDRNLMLKDVSGKMLPARKVFAGVIQYLMDDLVEVANNTIIKPDGEKTEKEAGHDGNGETSGLQKSDIKWVLTVPAIWDDDAKQFMQEAANEAGILNDALHIALEPEAASVYCRLLPAFDCQGSLSGLQPGHTYMILDAGGGTVDITVHEVEERGFLKEIHKASGGDWGGQRVNQEFEKFLQNLFGLEIMKTFKTVCPEDYFELMNDFEVKKRLDTTNIGEKVNVRIPLALTMSLEESGTSIKEKIQTSSYNDALTIRSDKMRINYALFGSFFNPSIQKTIAHVAEILSNVDVQGCNTILMVGGFSGSILLQNAIKDRFPLMHVVIPMEPELAIIKGAVIFGHDPSIIVQRKLKYTYGTKVVHEKDDSCTHPPTPVTIINGQPHCTNIFSAHVHVGDVFKSDEEAGITYFPTNPFADKVEVKLYVSKNGNPQLVTDESCKYAGTLRLEITPTFISLFLSQSRDQMGFSVAFMFGGTKLHVVKGVDKMTGREVEVSLDCLENDESNAATQK